VKIMSPPYIELMDRARRKRERKFNFHAVKSKIFPIALTILAVLSVHAQVRYEKDTVYRFSQKILRQSEENSAVNYPDAAQDFSFISDYENILRCDAKMRPPFGTINKSDSLYFATFRITDAKDYIIERAKNERIIIINEAHHIPYHRVFIASLLTELYKAGFRYYGAETINYLDSAINSRKYPVLTSGYYTVELQFGNLVRKALNDGYFVFGYEARSTESFSNPEVREIEQAKNIYRILQNDPNARILLHSGYDHIREDSVGGTWKKAMAARLTDLTGIDPFTINQEVLTERAHPSLENPYYKMLNVDRPSILVKENGELFSGPKGTHFYDVRMIHPRTHLVKGRPDWLLNNGARFIDIPKKKLPGYPCIAHAYKKGENTNDAVPIDVVEIPGADKMRPLALPPGEYIIRVRDVDNKMSEFDLKVN
jgi:hypothetical protein